MVEPRVTHFQIWGKDGKALQAYYAELFGWELNTDFPGGYGMTSPERTGIVVGVGSTPDGSPGHVTGYVSVADVDATLARVIELGGSVIRPRFSPAPGSNIALVADPEGHVVGLSEE